MSPGYANSGKFIVLGFTMLTFLLASCEEEGCNSCQQGSCIEEVCECEPYYEGDDCSVLSTEKFLGDWQKGDICNSGSEAGSSRVEATSTKGRIQIFSIGPENQPIFAEVTGAELLVSEQTYGGATITGLGAIDDEGSTVTLDYQIEYQDGVVDNCFSTLTH